MDLRDGEGFEGSLFFSRPRRFGKSLTLSVLKEIFEGNKELFQGLWICEAKYDWKKYPIIRIDFSKQKSKNTEQLDSIAEELGIAESQLLEKVQNWYNGYCFSSQGEKVYNPFSTLLLFKQREFKNCWFETGTQGFLVSLAKKKSFEIQSLPIEIGEMSFSTICKHRL